MISFATRPLLAAELHVFFLSASRCLVSVLLLMTHRHTRTHRLGNLAPCSSKPRHSGRSNELPSNQLMFTYRHLARVLLVLLKPHSPNIAGSAVNREPLSSLFVLWYHNKGSLQQVQEDSSNQDLTTVSASIRSKTKESSFGCKMKLQNFSRDQYFAFEALLERDVEGIARRFEIWTYLSGSPAAPPDSLIDYQI